MSGRSRLRWGSENWGGMGEKALGAVGSDADVQYGLGKPGVGGGGEKIRGAPRGCSIVAVLGS